MITEHDLEQAIAECQGERNPNANTCIKLAAFLTIRQEMFGRREAAISPGYSYSAGVEPQKTVTYESDTEFGKALYGRDADAMWAVMDELMSTVQAIWPKLYDAVMRKIE